MEASLRHAGVASRHLAGALLFDPEEHLSQTGRPFVQFGAFWRNCQTLPGPAEPESRPARITGAPPGVVVEALGITMTSARPSGGESEDLPESAGWTPRAVGPAGPWEPGEDGARTRLEGFLERALATYETSRDFPGIEGVSRLSPHLHFGEISPHQVWHTVRDACRSRGRALETGSEAPGAGGGEAFLRQLGWREFAHYLLFHFPAMPVEPFHPEFAAFPWADDPDGLAAWQQGATGYPLIDAGMRQLLAEGWMHNRVRMVVASFLTKDLMIPWQRGAAWFWDRLVDADLANNTLGWQWTAGSGPDAAPYFRVFNPALQARRFDGDSAYVRRWIPEAIADADEERGYPAPIVDHASARLRALAAFRELRRR
jgi:deoxyribodipyrimidine photo-lyase